jgi:molecular chaperone GrpE (heat shock protein)
LVHPLVKAESSQWFESFDEDSLDLFFADERGFSAEDAEDDFYFRVGGKYADDYYDRAQRQRRGGDGSQSDDEYDDYSSYLSSAESGKEPLLPPLGLSPSSEGRQSGGRSTLQISKPSNQEEPSSECLKEAVEGSGVSQSSPTTQTAQSSSTRSEPQTQFVPESQSASEVGSRTKSSDADAKKLQKQVDALKEQLSKQKAHFTKTVTEMKQSKEKALKKAKAKPRKADAPTAATSKAQPNKSQPNTQNSLENFKKSLGDLLNSHGLDATVLQSLDL